jgi:hypothetical protein
MPNSSAKMLRLTVRVCTPNFNIEKSSPTKPRIYVFCLDLRINSDYFCTQHSLIGFYNRGRECLLRGADWVFKSDRYCSVLKGLMTAHSSHASALDCLTEFRFYQISCPCRSFPTNYFFFRCKTYFTRICHYCYYYHLYAG